jgi:MFS transporter
MAIMGFGGGALIAAPLSVWLMAHFATPTSTGVMESFVTMGVIYFMFMMIGVFSVRVPSPDWKPAGWIPSTKPNSLITTANVSVDVAWKTPQFWLLWGVLCMNVTAGIGVLGTASPMIQEMFPSVNAVTAGAFVGLLSLFNMGGRFFWATTSDYIGRRATYMIFFLLGMALYASVPTIGHMGSKPLFVAAFCVILTMYGGGFATIPAYLRDIFGNFQVGAIHGRLLTAWSVAGVLGPVLVNYIRQAQIDSGVPKAQAYSVTMYIMAGLLLIGFICNFAMRAVDPKYHYKGAVGATDGSGH